MPFEFCKMHGLGNDYVYIDLFAQSVDADWAALARTVSDRHFGIGSDGVILVCPGTEAGVRMRIFNADGSEAEMCGNGLRCTVKYGYERKLLAGELGEPPARFAAVIGIDSPVAGTWRSARIETGAGVLTVVFHVTDADVVDLVAVDMGRPILQADMIPTTLTGPSVINHPIDLATGTVSVTCVSMGNPHAVIFTDPLDEIDLTRVGPMIENHDLFPNRTNVHFAHASSRDHARAVTWERGSGRTLACGTGACAICVAGVLENRLARNTTVQLPGGTVRICWDRSDSHVYMIGPAAEVFTGHWP